MKAIQKMNKWPDANNDQKHVFLHKIEKIIQKHVVSVYSHTQYPQSVAMTMQ